MVCTFNVSKWHAVSTRLHTPEHWQQWALGCLCPDDLPEQKPELAFLPALQRRRLSLATRLMFQAAHQVLGDECCPVVFVSHDGEINRSFQLWQNLLRDHTVSPTSFGLSVHNALVGQWSMLRSDMSESTALAAGQDGWEIAILEAASMLQEGADKVLVVAADEPLHHQYQVQSVSRAPFAYAVAALLTQGNQYTLSRQISTIKSPSKRHYWGALQWVRHQWQAHQQFVQYYSHSQWQWHITP